MIMEKSQWFRVSKENPCPICKKQDWCTLSKDVACCMRVQSKTFAKNGGWIHKLSDDAPKYVPQAKREEIKIDVKSIYQKWNNETKPDSLKGFAELLKLEVMALCLLGCAWAPESEAFAFPMMDERCQTIGIRLRNVYGKKWAVKGSKQGIFIPEIEFTKRLYIVEGPTDTAAALSLGFSVIGRPSCLGCEEMILQFIDIQKIKEVVIIADNDDVGIRGAEKLRSMLKVPSCLLIPPCKDVREFLQLGGTKEVLESMIKSLVWMVPKTILK